MDAAAVSIGSACGALSRYYLGQAATKQIAKEPTRWGHLTGWHTAGINVLGSFILGGVFALPVVAAEASSKSKVALSKATSSSPPVTQMQSLSLTPRAKLLLGVGFCGSFTTFSTFSVDIVNMVERGHVGKAMGYALINNIGGVGAAACGMLLVRKFFTSR